MKRNRTLPLALVTFAALTFASNAAWANHHWGNNNGMGNQGYSQLTQEQQATVQKLHNDYYAQTSALRQQLQSKRYEYNALLTAQKPDSGKIEAVAQEMEGLRQKLDQQRVKFDIALAEAGVPRGAGMGYGGCRGSAGGHMGMNHWSRLEAFFRRLPGAEVFIGDQQQLRAFRRLQPGNAHCGGSVALAAFNVRQGPAIEVGRNRLPFAGQHGMRGSVPAPLAQDDPPLAEGVAGLADLFGAITI